MRCIFCKNDSTESRSVEHIVPESLGNQAHVLPRGVVCDTCNNYFASKVEQPFLESPAIRSLRFRQGIPNKRGRVPSIGGLLWPGYSVQLTREEGFAGDLTLQAPDDAVATLLSQPTGRLILPLGGQLPDHAVVSRFLAKCAVEALAHRLVGSGQPLTELVDHGGLDELRSHARRGQPREWPYSLRTIHNEDAITLDGLPKQILHEYDILLTTPNRRTFDGSVLSESYFVLALFGVELAINMGGPEIDGYERWLVANNGTSPLYAGKNGPNR